MTNTTSIIFVSKNIYDIDTDRVIKLCVDITRVTGHADMVITNTINPHDISDLTRNGEDETNIFIIGLAPSDDVIERAEELGAHLMRVNI